MVAQNLLYLKQVDPGFNQVRGIAVAQTVRRDLFFSPQAMATWCRVFCTPPRSSGVRALCAPLKPPWRLGNINSGLRCVCQNRRNTPRVASGRGTSRSRLPLESRMCTRWRTASMSATFKAKPSLKRAGRRKQRLSLFDGDDVGQALDLGRFDEVGHGPGFAQHVLGVELETIQIELNGAP